MKKGKVEEGLLGGILYALRKRATVVLGIGGNGLGR